jgi:hypothetical protein
MLGYSKITAWIVMMPKIMIQYLINSIIKTRTRQPYQPITDKGLEKYYINFEQQKNRIKVHLEKSHKNIPSNKKPRLFVAIHDVNWELTNLVEPWNSIADIEHYDWGDKYDQYDPKWNEKKCIFCNELLDRVKDSHKKEHLDIFFSYLSGRWIYPDVISEINKLGIITINISFDDKLSFWGDKNKNGLSGNAEIAPAYDICITCQSSNDVSKYVYIGANPFFLPPAANPNTFDFEETTKDIPISFVGQNYGRRSEAIDMLLKHGIPISVYGKGWPSGEIGFSEKQGTLSRTLINLGFGYVGDSNHIVGLKERDFEIPLTGGLYITTYNPDLEACYILGDEIECYKDYSELVDKAKYYLSHPEDAKRKGLAGRERVLKEHTWKKRFGMVTDLLK